MNTPYLPRFRYNFRSKLFVWTLLIIYILQENDIIWQNAILIVKLKLFFVWFFKLCNENFKTTLVLQFFCRHFLNLFSSHFFFLQVFFITVNSNLQNNNYYAEKFALILYDIEKYLKLKPLFEHCNLNIEKYLNIYIDKIVYIHNT